MEIDVVAESLDGQSLLLGEMKWSDKDLDPRRLAEDLRARAARAPFVRGRRIVLALWLKKPLEAGDDVEVVAPEAVLKALR